RKTFAIIYTQFSSVNRIIYHLNLLVFVIGASNPSSLNGYQGSWKNHRSTSSPLQGSSNYLGVGSDPKTYRFYPF
ncbi:hypothetical protein OQJ66_20635, partial [Aquimarina muelleri]|uniref:hypothetical protein n=1 Tax=Aquimarina muelleri TaxID=279356 RepID=UPI002248B2FE